MQNLIFKGLNGEFKIVAATQYIPRIKDSTNKMVAFGVEQKICLSRKHVFTLHAPNEKDAMTSRCLDRKRKYDAPPGECTLLAGPAGIIYRQCEKFVAKQW